MICRICWYKASASAFSKLALRNLCEIPLIALVIPCLLVPYQTKWGCKVLFHHFRSRILKSPCYTLYYGKPGQKLAGGASAVPVQAPSDSAGGESKTNTTGEAKRPVGTAAVVTMGDKNTTGTLLGDMACIVLLSLNDLFFILVFLVPSLAAFLVLFVLPFPTDVSRCCVLEYLHYSRAQANDPAETNRAGSGIVLFSMSASTGVNHFWNGRLYVVK